MIKVTEQLICSIEDCNEEHHGLGLCKKHYMKLYKKQWNRNNKEKRAGYDKQYHLKNEEHIAEYHKQWLKTPSGKASKQAIRHNRRTLEKDLTKETVQHVYEDNIKKYGTLTCILCGEPVEFVDSSLEHLTPLSRGGSNNYENLGIAHLTCNIRKQAKTLNEWFEKALDKQSSMV